MTIHLLPPKGYAITTCGLTAVRLLDGLTADIHEHTCEDCAEALINRNTCRICGEEGLTWTAHEGATFTLRCDHCREPLKAGVSATRVAQFLTDERWRP